MFILGSLGRGNYNYRTKLNGIIFYCLLLFISFLCQVLFRNWRFFFFLYQFSPSVSRFRTSPKSLSGKFVDISWVRWTFVTYIRGYQLFPINPSPSSQCSCQMSNDCLARPRVPTLLPPLFLQCIRRDGSCTQMNVGKGSCAPPGLRRFKKRVHLPHSFFHPFVASWGHQGSHEKPRRLQDVNQINPEWRHGVYHSTAAKKFGIYSCWVPEILGVSGTAVIFILTSTQPNLHLF